MSRAAIYLMFMIACSSRTEPPRREPPVPASEGPPARAVETPEPEPSPGVRPDQEPPRASGRPVPARAVRPIEVVLRSSPSGATAAVDGALIGPTPAFWPGQADGREHEFTFVLAGYAPARYRFVPITSGVVHARLEVIADEPDAGVPARIRPVDPVSPGEPSRRRPPMAPDSAPVPLDAASQP